jgi:uncharacterized protein (TIGR02118 family)
MIRVTVMYPQAEGTTFDFDYYKATHMPLVQKVMPGVLRTEIDKPVVPGPYACVGHLYFESMATFGAAAGAPDAGQAQADIPNFTNAVPVMQISEVWG